LDAFGTIDSKYRFIILAAKRAKQLLKGAKPKFETRSKSPVRIAQAEVRRGLVEYEIIPTRMDDIPDGEERDFVGGGIAEEALEADTAAEKVVADEETEADAVEADEDDEEDESEDGSDLDKDD